MFRVLPIIAALLTVFFLIMLIIEPKTEVPFSLTVLAERTTELGQPGTPNALLALQKQPLCAANHWSLDSTTPAKVYQVTIPPKALQQHKNLVFFQHAAINNQFAIVYGQPNQCWHIKASGRSLPFAQRFVRSMFPNNAISGLTDDSNIYIILQDAKSRNLWLGITDRESFQKQASHKWLICGLYIGALLIYTVIGLTIGLWQRNKLALAYACYTVITVFWFAHNFAITDAFIPNWNSTGYFNYLHNILTGLIVCSIAIVCLLFLHMPRLIKVGFIATSSLVALMLFAAPFYSEGYRFATAALTLLTVFTLFYVAKSLFSENNFDKVFALGLICTLTAGGVQEISALTGYSFAGFAIFAFPIGNFLESTFWLMAIGHRLVNEFKRIQTRMLFDATHDSLTGLANRTYLENRLRILTETYQLKNKCLFFIDLDNFKRINESMGHATGDHILGEIAKRLRLMCHNADTIARFGGDEFCILVDNINDPVGANQFGEKLIKTVSKPIDLAGRKTRLAASVGACVQLQKYQDAETIVRNADLSVYVAKRQGRAQVVVFSDALHEQAIERFQIEQDILPSLKRKDFYVYYQPIVEVASGKLAGFEALLRWQHPTLGWLPPNHFIPVAEDCGLIRRISEEVIAQATKTIAQWQQAGLWSTGAYVSINIAGQLLLDDGLCKVLLDAVNKEKICARDIRIEVTESSLVTDFPRVYDMLSKLKACGFKILIDDFGAGYSSLHYLHQLPFDVLKIDRSFIYGIDEDPKKQALTQTIIRMAELLNLDIIAEGVELDVHHELLCNYGCPKAQGYYYGEAKPEALAMQQWLEKADKPEA